MRIATSLARSLAGIALLAALAAGCSDDSATPRTGPADAAYAGFGAYPVGVTTLDLQDRQVEVWYPTDASRTAGRTKASYVAFEVLPPAIVAILPPDSNLEIGMDAYRDVAPAAFWDVVTHFTVAHVRAAFGVDETPVGLGDGVAEAFDDVTLRYRHDP